MMNNIEKIKEMLPDYLQGKLDAAKSEEIRKAIQASPELQQESKELNEIFGKINSYDYYKDFAYASRNIEAKVIETMSTRKSKRRFGLYFGLALPSAALILIAVLFYPFRDNLDTRGDLVDSETGKNAQSVDTVMMIADKVVTDAFFEDYIDEESVTFDEIVPPNLSSYFESVDEKINDEFVASYGDEILETAEYMQVEDELFAQTDFTAVDLNSLVDTENEEDLEILLEVMKNVSL